MEGPTTTTNGKHSENGAQRADDAPPRFVHLHVHTEYSLLDGACRIKDLVAAAKRMNMPALAITDHGNMFGAIEFYTAARDAGVKPIIGCETYLAPGDRREKTAANGRETAYHQLLLAMNLEGYRNLIKLSSIGYVEGFYYKPRIDLGVLREHNAGLICTSTCLGGMIPQALLRQDLRAARRIAEQFLTIFGPDRFFIELQNHNLPEQAQTNPELAELAAKLGVGLIATNDVHYLTHDDVEAHDVLCCISTRAKVSEENRFKFDSDQFYLKSPAEMAAALPAYREALENTLRVADLCNLEFDFSKRYSPTFRTPGELSADEYLRQLVYAGALERYGRGRSNQEAERDGATKRRSDPGADAPGETVRRPTFVEQGAERGASQDVPRSGLVAEGDPGAGTQDDPSLVGTRGDPDGVGPRPSSVDPQSEIEGAPRAAVGDESGASAAYNGLPPALHDSAAQPPPSNSPSSLASPPSSLSSELIERIEYELSVISSKGFSGYFLIVWDVVRFCAENDIPCNARGSGCSTVVGYCLRISSADPLRYGLYFERFMDPERDEMPDIDIDMCQDRRGEVIEYVRRKYGHVAQIITFGRLKAKAAIRDICRALDVPLARADRVAKLVPEELKMTIDKAVEREPELRKMRDEDPAIRKVLDIGRRLEGLARHASVHAAGVVIADQPLDTLIPLHKPADAGDVTTQFEGPTVEKVGLLKMDFLGLRTLSMIHLTCKLVQRNHGVRINLEALDLTDQRVYEILQRGETRGVFQFESGGMRDVLMKMKPNRIEDLIAANALFRPGPMAYIDDYVARKHGRTHWTTPHPIMTQVLAETYGIMVYQEQVSRLVNRLGDVPLRRAFRLAKAISKKKESMINAEREPFLAGAEKNGVPRAVGEQIFADILKFGGYAFNKAHSTGYALVAFQTAYLKTYYPAEFMAALLTYEAGSKEKVAEYIDECRRVRQADGSIGIPVLPPDVNESDEGFTVVYCGAGASPTGGGPAAPRPSGREGNGAARACPAADLPGNNAARRGRIRFGLSAINGVGHKAVQAIREARRSGGRFRDLYDFCERVDLQVVNKGVVEALIKAGAFDSTGAMRRAMCEVLEATIELGAQVQRDKRGGQLDMFGAFSASAPPPPPPIAAREWSDAEMLAHEKATLGYYITKHPLAQYEAVVRAFSAGTTLSLRQYTDGASITLGGLISKVRAVPIKQGRSAGKKMLIATLEDFVGSIEAIAFPDQVAEIAPMLKPDAVAFIEGDVDRRREEPCVRIARIIPIDAAIRELSRRIVVRVSAVGGRCDQLGELRALCARHRGRCPVYIEVQSSAGWVATIKAREGVFVDPTEEFLRAAKLLAGADNVLCAGLQRAFVPSV